MTTRMTEDRLKDMKEWASNDNYPSFGQGRVRVCIAEIEACWEDVAHLKQLLVRQDEKIREVLHKALQVPE